MKDIDKRLDEILDKYYQGRTLDWIKQNTSFSKIGEENKPAEWFKETIIAIKQLMAEEFEKMIDEDDEYDALTIDSDYDYAARNQLRNELRKKLEEFRK